MVNPDPDSEPEPEPEPEPDPPGKKRKKRYAKGNTKYDISIEKYAELVIKKYGPFHYDGAKKKWWRWNEHFWEPIREAWFLHPSFMVQHNPRSDRRAKHIVQTIAHMSSPHASTSGFPSWKGISWFKDESESVLCLNVANGTIEVDFVKEEISLRESRAEDMSSASLPILYDPEAQCPIFDRVGKSCLPDPEDFRLLLLFTAYALWPKHNFQVILYCQGPPNTGKSLLILEGIRKGLFGEERTSDVSLEMICNKGDQVRLLEDSLANFGNEINAVDLRETAFLIKLADGKSISADLKYREGEVLHPRCKHIFVGNPLPRWAKGSEAEIRRVRLLHFGEDFSTFPKDGQLERDIAIEGSGILNRILDALPELRGLAHMPHGGTRSRQFAAQFVEMNNPIETFAKFWLVFGPDQKIASEKLRAAYREWSADLISEGPNPVNITRILKQFHPEIYSRDVQFGHGRITRKIAKMVFGVGLNEAGKVRFEGKSADM